MTKLNKKQTLLLENFKSLDFKTNFPLHEITYFQVGGPAKLLVTANNHQELINLVRFCHQEKIEFVILGGASNVIVSDEGVDKVVIVSKNDSIKVIHDGSSSSVILRAECGVRTSKLVKKSVDLGFTGLEPFMGLPGRLGGAVYNNSHFREFLIGDFISQVEFIDPSGRVCWLSKDECDFKYDSSRFQKTNEVILRVDFLLNEGDQAISQEIMKQTMIYRTSTQPLDKPSSGCIFKNVPNTDRLRKLFPQFLKQDFISAGFLIDKAGLKGIKVGGIQVSHKHASFMVNLGDGTTKDIKQLILKVKEEILTQFQVDLEEEVFWLG